LPDPYSKKTRDTIDTLIDVEQIWRETVPPDHKLSEDQKEVALRLLREAQKNVEELLKLVEGKKK
jgi:hypothetical protein